MNGLPQALKLFNSVMSSVVTVEQATAPVMPGPDKKALIFSVIQHAAKVGEVIPVPQVQMVSGLIDAIVAAFNASGVFKHAKP